MGMTLQPSIDAARTILNDTNSASYRYSTADLLQYANDALDVALKLAPNFFYVWGDMVCEAGETLQAASFTDAHMVVEGVRVKNGAALRQFDKSTMDTYNPDWHNTTPAAATEWCRSNDDPVRFWIYPPSPASQTLQVLYVKTPDEYAATDDTGLPTTMQPAITDYVVYMAESRDDEHVNSARQQQFYQSFAAKLKGA